jgi:hypothetical protein
MNATVSIVCYKQKTLKNGEHPLMIRVSKGGKKKYKSLGLSVHPDHWDFKTNRPKPKCPNRELILKTILEKEIEFQKEILELVSMQKEYTASSLIAVKTNQIKAISVGDFFEEQIRQFEKVNRVNYARSFRHTRNSIKRFCGNDLDFPFSDIDAEWLGRYEQWLKDYKCTEVTIFTLFRNIRSAYNKAISEQCVLKSSYPFIKYKISKFDVSTQKRAIPKDDIKSDFTISCAISYDILKENIDILNILGSCDKIKKIKLHLDSKHQDIQSFCENKNPLLSIIEKLKIFVSVHIQYTIGFPKENMEALNKLMEVSKTIMNKLPGILELSLNLYHNQNIDLQDINQKLLLLKGTPICCNEKLPLKAIVEFKNAFYIMVNQEMKQNVFCTPFFGQKLGLC